MNVIWTFLIFLGFSNTTFRKLDVSRHQVTREEGRTPSEYYNQPPLLGLSDINPVSEMKSFKKKHKSMDNAKNNNFVYDNTPSSKA